MANKKNFPHTMEKNVCKFMHHHDKMITWAVACQYV